MIAGSATQITPSFDTGQAGLVGAVSVMITDTDGNVIVAPSSANIIEVTDPDPTGVYVAVRTAPGPTGAYLIIWSTDGTFDAETVAEEDLTVVAGVPTPVLPPIPVGPGAGPASGPCASWVTADDVAAFCGVTVDSTNVTALDDAAAASSQVLFELSGRQFSAQCEQTERPCASGCGCWPAILSPMSPGAPQVPLGLSWGWWGLGWGWGWPGCGDSPCGCGTLSRANLSGYPVSAITQVLIDGVVLPETDDDGFLNYRLDEFRYLTRIAGIGGVERFWPACQWLDREPSETGTWAVTFAFGQDPPVPGVMAAAQLGCEIFKASAGQACALPERATRVTRQGIEIQLTPFVSWAQKGGAWATGLILVDMFLQAYNPNALRRRSTSWSPDVQPFAKRLGS